MRQLAFQDSKKTDGDWLGSCSRPRRRKPEMSINSIGSVPGNAFEPPVSRSKEQARAGGDGEVVQIASDPVAPFGPRILLPYEAVSGPQVPAAPLAPGVPGSPVLPVWPVSPADPATPTDQLSRSDVGTPDAPIAPDRPVTPWGPRILLPYEAVSNLDVPVAPVAPGVPGSPVLPVWPVSPPDSATATDRLSRSDIGTPDGPITPDSPVTPWGPRILLPYEDV
jgi:hypothetical protein